MKRLILLLSACLALCATAAPWGEGSFENDDAAKWVQQCLQSSGTELVAAALQSALESELVEAADGAVAIAAIEVIAAARGKPGPGLPPELQEWLARQPQAAIAALVPQAREALERIRDPAVSELQQRWAESGAKRWNAQVAELASRLNR